MLICDRCGQVIAEEDLDLTHDRDYVNNGVGRECVRDDEFYKECGCGGDWVDATECKVCGEWFNDEHYRKVCDDCLDENATFENAIKMGDEEYCQHEVKINGYLANEFSTDQIEAILERELVEAEKLGTALSYREYLFNDKDAYADWLNKENI